MADPITLMMAGRMAFQAAQAVSATVRGRREMAKTIHVKEREVQALRAALQARTAERLRALAEVTATQSAYLAAAGVSGGAMQRLWARAAGRAAGAEIAQDETITQNKIFVARLEEQAVIDRTRSETLNAWMQFSGQAFEGVLGPTGMLTAIDAERKYSEAGALLSSVEALQTPDDSPRDPSGVRDQLRTPQTPFDDTTRGGGTPHRDLPEPPASVRGGR